MSNEPAWVEPSPEAEPAPPPDERAILIESIKACNEAMVTSINIAKNALLRLDEIGSPVSRSRSRINKVDEIRTDWWAHFDYDVIKGNTKGTKDQQVRAERYELS
jgi:hypothetical protein